MSHPRRIVILGGGFGDLEVAQHLDRLFRDDQSVDLALVNRDNYFSSIGYRRRWPGADRESSAGAGA
jgi:NADH dehydrogenase FAD-containing subunit